MESNFKHFQHLIKGIGGVFATSNVYFSQMRDGYSAAYKPEYPNSSLADMIINTIDKSGAYLRGNYELIRYDTGCGKFHSEYFESVKDIKNKLYDDKTTF